MGYFVISLGILPILPPYFTNFVFFLVTTKKLSSNLESQHFSTFCERRQNLEDEEKVMEKYFIKSVGSHDVLITDNDSEVPNWYALIRAPKIPVVGA